jgi:hypothetical protein
VQWAVVRLGNAGTAIYALDDCDGEAPTLYVRNDLAEQVGKVVLVDDTCYVVRLPEAGEVDDDPCTAQCVEIAAEYEDCDRCKGCWLLQDCDETEPDIVTNTDLAEWEGKVVRVDGVCYEVSLADNCLDAVAVTVDDGYDDCDACANCYHLENCWDDEDTLTISNDLAAITEADPATMVAEDYVFEINGKCYELTGYDTNCAGAERVTVDAWYLSCGDCGCYKLTECPGGAGNEIYARSAQDRDGEIVRLRNLVGQVVRLDDGDCYSVATDEANCETAVDVTVYEAYDDCDACTCYTLEDCESAAANIVTYTDLAGLGHAVGDVLELDGEAATCYEITADDTAYSGAAKAVTILSAWPDCDTCAGEQQYELTHDCQRDDCGDAEAKPDIITTDRRLYSAVGKYVKVGGYCYVVATTSEHTGALESIEYQGPYADCNACLAAPVTTRKVVLTGLAIDGTDIVAETEEWIIENGLVVGFCKGDDITIEGTECEE